MLVTLITSMDYLFKSKLMCSNTLNKDNVTRTLNEIDDFTDKSISLTLNIQAYK